MTHQFDIDMDFADREAALDLIQHTRASQIQSEQLIPHNTGVYVNPVPVDALTGLCSLDYQLAENLGYIKLDFLNNYVYTLIRDTAHLNQLLATEPNWQLLRQRRFVEQLVHINAHYDLLEIVPEPVNSIPRMAMFLSLIRPAKRHLLGKPWAEVAKTVWEKNTDGQYGFKMGHAIAYATLVAVHMNLIAENFN